MACPRCHRLREFEAATRSDEVRPSHDDGNDADENVEEGYMYVSPIRQPIVKYLNPYDQCFCRDQRLLEQERRRTGIEIPGKCYPVDMCTNCDLNYSGLCPQQNKYDSGIFIDDIPVYPIIPPYVRPAYYPYTPWYPYSPFRPAWPRNGYRPRPRPSFPRDIGQSMSGMGRRMGMRGGGRP